MRHWGIMFVLKGLGDREFSAHTPEWCTLGATTIHCRLNLSGRSCLEEALKLYAQTGNEAASSSEASEDEERREDSNDVGPIVLS